MFPLGILSFVALCAFQNSAAMFMPTPQIYNPGTQSMSAFLGGPVQTPYGAFRDGTNGFANLGQVQSQMLGGFRPINPYASQVYPTYGAYTGGMPAASPFYGYGYAPSMPMAPGYPQPAAAPPAKQTKVAAKKSTKKTTKKPAAEKVPQKESKPEAAVNPKLEVAENPKPVVDEKPKSEEARPQTPTEKKEEVATSSSDNKTPENK